MRSSSGNGIELPPVVAPPDHSLSSWTRFETKCSAGFLAFDPATLQLPQGVLHRVQGDNLLWETASEAFGDEPDHLLQLLDIELIALDEIGDGLVHNRKLPQPCFPFDHR